MQIGDSCEDLKAKVDEQSRELGEVLDQQTATAEVLQAISRSAFDLRTVLDTLLNSATRLCRIETSALYLLRDGHLHLEASTANRPEWVAYKKAHPQPLTRDVPSSRAALTREIDHVPDILLDPELTSAPELHRIGGYRATLNVPLIREGSVIGVLSLARNEPGLFPTRQIELVKTFADQAVIAIENTRLISELRARTDHLRESLQQQTATADVLKVISRSAFDLKSVLHTLVESAVHLCQADKGTITRQIDDKLYRAESYGFSQEYMDYVRVIPIIPDRGSASGRALLERRPVHIPDVETDPDYDFREAQRIGGFRALLGVPMLREGVPIGVFVLTRDEPKPFTETQIALATTFADQAAIAIENVRLFDEVKARTEELTKSLQDLRTAQERLIQTEKLASLGQLTAGIAHEIKNPLNFVNNFAALSGELVDELREALRPAHLDAETRAEVDEITDMLKGNLAKVVQHGKRADSIVKNMLAHSRTGSDERRSVDVNALVDDSLNLAYHGARAERAGLNVTLARDFDPEAGTANLYPQEITRVLLNLIGNGFYATAQREAEGNADYQPHLSVATRDRGACVEIRVRDNGTGIPEGVRAKMFDPFFTTKPAGEGTGLGLSLSHDIVVHRHGGTIDVATEVGCFTEFTIVLPRSGAAFEQAESAT